MFEKELNEFEVKLTSLTFGGKYDKREVLNDFLLCAATSISNAVDRYHREKREENYLKTIEKYAKGEQTSITEGFSDMLHILISALEKEPADFLGELYSKLGFCEIKNLKQNFTPSSVSSLISGLSVNDIRTSLYNEEDVDINEPCIGAGGIVIGLISALGRDARCQKHLHIYGQDISLNAVLMAYIQLSLLGYKAVIKVGDVFSDPFTDKEDTTSYKLWYTPMCFLN